MKKVILGLIVIIMVLGSFSISLASSAKKNVSVSTAVTVTATTDISTDTEKDKKADKIKDAKEDKSIEEVDKETKEVKVKYASMNKILNQYKVLLKTVNASNAADKAAKIARLEAKITALSNAILEARTDLTEDKEALKSKVLATYTEEEKAKLSEIVAALQKDDGVSVLPYQNIYAKGKSIKFDTPPVIKEGRTLVPIRALSAAYGFEVKYNAETKEVTLIKEGFDIKFTIGSNEATVNGEKITLDVSAQVYNSRTVIPLRFIAEKMGLKVDWDDETKTIDVEDKVEAEENDEENKTEEELDKEVDDINNLTEDTTASTDTTTTTSTETPIESNN